MAKLSSVLSFKNVKSQTKIDCIIEDINRSGGNVEHQSFNTKEQVAFITVKAFNEVDFWLEFKNKDSCTDWVSAQEGKK